MRRVLSAVAAVVVGVLAGFFLVFNALFTDGPGDVLHPEYLVAYLLVLTVYGAAAYAVARWGGWGWWTAAWLATPGMLLVAAYWDPSPVLRALVGLALSLGTVGGVLLGRRQATKPAAGETT